MSRGLCVFSRSFRISAALDLEVVLRQISVCSTVPVMNWNGNIFSPFHLLLSYFILSEHLLVLYFWGFKMGAMLTDL